MKIVIVFLLRCYKLFVSPFLGCNCRFEPTCSEYTKQAICKYGVLKGLFLGSRRILKCNPWGGSGYDPVP